MSNSELSNNQGSDQLITRDLSKWNPFEDRTPFSQMTEDHIFGAEFDKIRREGSQNSEYYSYKISRIYLFSYTFRYIRNENFNRKCSRYFKRNSRG